jgi:hypothetical protein
MSEQMFTELSTTPPKIPTPFAAYGQVRTEERDLTTQTRYQSIEMYPKYPRVGPRGLATRRAPNQKFVCRCVAQPPEFGRKGCRG